jgi:hypothetical protein
MFTTGVSSRTTSRVERHGRRAIGMRPILATTAIAATVVSAISITPPAFARSNTGGGGYVSGPSSGGPRQPNYNSTRAPNPNISGAHYLNGSGSARQFSSSGGREGWHSSGTPPGWTGHGEKRGWDGGRMPPGLSHHDRDTQCVSGNSTEVTRGLIASARSLIPVRSNGGGVGDAGYARKPE